MKNKWTTKTGEVISCIEKNKVLNENLLEIIENIKYAYEDAVLLGVTQENFHQNLLTAINECYNLKT